MGLASDEHLISPSGEDRMDDAIETVCREGGVRQTVCLGC